MPPKAFTKNAMNRLLFAILLIAQGFFLSVAPARCDPAPDAQGRFDIVAAPTAVTDWAGVKYDRVTGQTWIAVKGKWSMIEEKDDLPKSIYKIIIIPLSNDFEAVRIDTHSGKSWRLRGGKWQSMD